MERDNLNDAPLMDPLIDDQGCSYMVVADESGNPVITYLTTRTNVDLAQ